MPAAPQPQDTTKDVGPPPCPVKDCIIPVDIFLESSDGCMYGAHTKNLQQFSEGFPFGSSVTIDIPKLPENGQVLDLLMKFMHHTRQPSLENVPVNVLSQLAEAVEKYMVYSAMELCRLHMKLTVQQHPIDVLLYGVKHDYTDLADAAARFTLNTDAQTMIQKSIKANLHSSFLTSWFLYRETWASHMKAVAENPPNPSSSLHKGGITQCKEWEPFRKEVMLKVGVGYDGLLQLAQIINDKIDMLSECVYCTKRGERWAHHAKTVHAANSSTFR